MRRPANVSVVLHRLLSRNNVAIALSTFTRRPAFA